MNVPAAFRGLGAAAALLLPLSAEAGLPRPGVLIACFPNEGPICNLLCSTVLGAPAAGCQHRFRIGDPEALTVTVTLRDHFDGGYPGAPTTVALVPNAGTIALCGCCPLSQVVVSDAAGALTATFHGIGGAGSLDVTVTAHPPPYHIPISRQTIDFSTPDLDGSCDGTNSTDIADLGRWAAGLSSYVLTSDFTCDGTVNVADLGYWAQGLGHGCAEVVCP